MNEEKSESRRAVKLPPYPGLEKVHRANLRLLKEIDRICRKYKISYMLDSGTLLGAVRHEGFIPWDDDVDLAFTRANYEMFLKVAPRELPEGMSLLRPEEIRGGKVFYDFTTRVIYDNSRVHEDNEQMQFYEGKLNHLLRMCQAAFPFRFWCGICEMVMVIVKIRISKMFCTLAARHRSSGQTGVHTGLIECQRIERSKHTKIWKDRYVIFTVAVAVRGDVNDQGNMEVWTSIHNGFCVFRHTAV